MIKFAVAGSLNYKDKINYLSNHGYNPELVIGDEDIISYKDIIKKKGIELLVCFAYPNILKNEEINLFSKGCINYHSGLPKYRGRHPLNWMIIDGISKIPNAIHFIDEGIDTGDIIIKRDIIRNREDDYYSLLSKQTILSQELMLEAICMIESGEVIREPQFKSDLGYTRKRTPEDSMLDWRKTSSEIHNFVSALVDPMPNAFSKINGKKIEIQKSYIGNSYGIVLGSVADGRYVISTGDGVVLVDANLKLQVGDQLI
jgi:methionyl-tRNA formyltransferase